MRFKLLTEEPLEFHIGCNTRSGLPRDSLEKMHIFIFLVLIYCTFKDQVWRSLQIVVRCVHMHLKIFRKNRSWYYRREWMGLNNLVGAQNIYECKHMHCACMRACQRVLLVLLFIHLLLLLHARIKRRGLDRGSGASEKLQKYRVV